MYDLITRSDIYQTGKTKVEGIYLLMIDKHVYIGSTNNISSRLYKHRSSLLNNKHFNPFLQNCFNKYQEVYFDILETFTTISKTKILFKEKFWINIMNADLNMTDPTLSIGDHFCKKVYQYSKTTGLLLNEWNSATEAAETLNITRDPIHSTAGGSNKNHKSAHGYVWSYEKVDKIVYKNNTGNNLEKCKVKLFDCDNEIEEFNSISDSARFVAEQLNRNFKNVRSALFKGLETGWKVGKRYHIKKL